MKRKPKPAPKLYRLGVFTVTEPDHVKQFGPLFTDSADDRDTMKQVIDGFNQDMAANPEPWCIAPFTAELATVAS